MTFTFTIFEALFWGACCVWSGVVAGLVLAGLLEAMRRNSEGEDR